MKLRVVALDLSLQATGIAHTHDHHGEPAIGCRTIHATTMTGHPRIHHILADVAAAVRCNPHLVLIESVFAGTGKGGTPLRLAELHGVVTHWLWNRGCPYVYVEPQQIKIWATGSGNATKTAVREAVTADYGHLAHIGDDNMSDSLALLALGLHAYGEPLATVLNPRKLRAVDAVKWPSLDPAAGGADAFDRRPSQPGQPTAEVPADA